jgi:hypothetical protein
MLFDRRALRLIVASLIAGWLALAASAVHAVAVTDLYEVTLPIQGNRDAAFSEALKVVAVRVSGRRDAAVRIGSAANARQFVQRFSFTADNQLQVAFHAGSVDRVLSEAGLPVWGRERPLTLVLLNAPTGAAGSMWIESSYPAAERELLAKAAQARGVPLAWPLLDSQSRDLLEAGGSGAELLNLAARHNANAVLVGRARRDASGQLLVHWTLRSDEGAAEITGSLEDGAHLVADTFGRIYAASAGAVETITAEVAGIRNLDDYATTMNYLESMTLVRNVAVETVSGDTMRFLLTVRGDAAALRRALALDNKLVPAGDEIAAGRLQLRLQR